MRYISIVLDMAFGLTFGGNIQDTYFFLIDHCEEGDRVFLFGFSPGAFTVRALSRLLYKCGLLDIGCKRLMPYVIKYYHDRGTHGIENDFKKTCCRACKPYFISPWDTVGSLGLSARCWKLSDFELNPDVRYAYQVLAINEERHKFPVVLWNEYKSRPDQCLEQVWFAGVHSDVGGGYAESGLSDITLKWMLDKASIVGLLIAETEGVHPDPIGELHKSRRGLWSFLPRKRRFIPEGERSTAVFLNR